MAGVVSVELRAMCVLVQGSIPKDVYGTEADTSTVGVMNVMLASKELSEENVYKMLDGFYSEQGLKTIGESYPIVAQGIQLNAALRGIHGTPIQLHPGAEKFYREMGVGDYSDNHSNDVSSDVTTIGS